MAPSPSPTPEVLAGLGQALAASMGGPCRLRHALPVGGGCISSNYRIDDGRRSYFLKLGRASREQFAAEADGLAALARCDRLVVPRVLALGTAGGLDFLVLEWLELAGTGDEARLGEALAALHGIAFPRFGWQRDNYIGSTPQANAWNGSWPNFFAERRLRPQLSLAAGHGAPELLERAAPLLAAPEKLLAGHGATPGLVHGDLWSGNKGFVAGRPALFDPAVYAGDGETDLALAELFGGFGPRFFSAYRCLRPLAPGYETRRSAYQLYHVVNHFNIFGGAYRRQALALIEALRRRLG